MREGQRVGIVGSGGVGHVATDANAMEQFVIQFGLLISTVPEAYLCEPFTQLLKPDERW